MQHVYRKGYHAVGTGGYQEFGAILPEYWTPRQKLLDNCPAVLKWYKEYSKYRAKWERLSFGEKLGSKGGKLKDQMQKAEKQGKAAWEECKPAYEAGVVEEIDTEQDLQDGGYIPSDLRSESGRSLLAIGLGGAAVIGLIAYLAAR